MKVKIELDCTPEEFQEMFIPSDKQQEFLTVTYDAYADALRRLMWKQIDPYDYLKPNKDD